MYFEVEDMWTPPVEWQRLLWKPQKEGLIIRRRGPTAAHISLLRKPLHHVSTDFLIGHQHRRHNLAEASHREPAN